MNCFVKNGFRTTAFGLRTGKRLGIRLLFLIIVLAGLPHATNGQAVVDRVPLRATVEGELSTYWQVLDAGFREAPTGTWGYIKLKNVSESLLQDTVVYGEYFNSEHRLCFSLVFSLRRNPQDEEPIRPGEIREVDSDGFGLFPAVEPEEVKLYLVRVTTSNQSNPIRNWDVTIRGPVTVSGGGGSRLQLETGVSSALGASSDLMFARLTVDNEGRVENLDVLQASTSLIESWFRDFVAGHLALFPATERGVPEKGSALILVRVARNSESQQEPFIAPRTSPWVKAYVGASGDRVVPPVTTLVFMRPPTKVKPLGSNTSMVDRPPLPPGLFELTLGDSRWSEPAAHWVKDPSAPGKLRREVGFSSQTEN